MKLITREQFLLGEIYLEERRNDVLKVVSTLAGLVSQVDLNRHRDGKKKIDFLCTTGDLSLFWRVDLFVGKPSSVVWFDKVQLFKNGDEKPLFEYRNALGKWKLAKGLEAENVIPAFEVLQPFIDGMIETFPQLGGRAELFAVAAKRMRQ